MISLLSLLLLTTTTTILLLTTTPVVLADDENVIDIVDDDAVIDDTPNLPTFLPKECSDNLDNLLPCWLDNNDECSNCAISEDGSLEGFLEFFKPPDTIFDTKYDSFFSTATTSTSSLECSDIETPICPTINCCTSCEESILELYECWLLVQSEDDERVSIISDNDNDNGSNSTGSSSSSSVLLLENCSFECNIDTNTTTNTTTARGTSILPPPV